MAMTFHCLVFSIVYTTCVYIRLHIGLSTSNPVCKRPSEFIRRRRLLAGLIPAARLMLCSPNHLVLARRIKSTTTRNHSLSCCHGLHGSTTKTELSPRCLFARRPTRIDNQEEYISLNHQKAILHIAPLHAIAYLHAGACKLTVVKLPDCQCQEEAQIFN